MNNQSRASRGIVQTWHVAAKPAGGTHLKVGQVLPPGNWQAFDPFLVMMEDWFQQGTFDFHPHRGMETVTFVLEGRLKHEDNHGGHGILEPGDVQWMTAGRGIIHSEDPLPGETVHSLQLWVNLPRAKKMAAPHYQDLHAADMPVRQEEGAEIRVFAGSSGGVSAPTQTNIPVTVVELRLAAGASVTQELPGSFNGFVYVLEGSGRFGRDETKGDAQHVLWLGSSDGADESELVVRADEPLRAILVAGEPIGEPVVAHGPFVMNTQDEIREAFNDFYSGKFGKA